MVASAYFNLISKAWHVVQLLGKMLCTLHSIGGKETGDFSACRHVNLGSSQYEPTLAAFA